MWSALKPFLEKIVTRRTPPHSRREALEDWNETLEDLTRITLGLGQIESGQYFGFLLLSVCLLLDLLADYRQQVSLPQGHRMIHSI
jgi:hypothetical protein